MSQAPMTSADMGDHLYQTNDSWPPKQQPPQQQQMQQQPMGGDGRHPPVEAMQACQGQPVAGVCSFVTPRGDHISGQCHQTPDGVVACVSSGMRPQ
jgi:hypothetical protein